jgi:hypothetical protein
MQTLEKSEDRLPIVGSNTDAIVADREYPLISLSVDRDMHPQTSLLAAVLDCIADKVLEQLLEVRVMYVERRQRVIGNVRSGWLDHATQVREAGAERLLCFCGYGRPLKPGYLRVAQ